MTDRSSERQGKSKHLKDNLSSPFFSPQKALNWFGQSISLPTALQRQEKDRTSIVCTEVCWYRFILFYYIREIGENVCSEAYIESVRYIVYHWTIKLVDQTVWRSTFFPFFVCGLCSLVRQKRKPWTWRKANSLYFSVVRIGRLRSIPNWPSMFDTVCHIVANGKTLPLIAFGNG